MGSDGDFEASSYTYEVTVEGRVSAAMADDLGAVRLSEEDQTILVAKLPDQAALQGLLRRLEFLGLNLIEVKPRR